MFRVSSVIAVAFVAFCVAIPRSRSAEMRTVPLHFHIVAGVRDSFVTEQREAADRVFASIGVRFVEVARDVLPARHAALRSRADRDALGRFVQRGAIHCMVVAELMDVDEPGRVRRGVHWRVRADRARHFVIVSAISGPYVLAHELGHFLGNPAHSDVRDNLMSYDQSGALPILSPIQVSNVQETLADMFGSGELRSGQRRSSARRAPTDSIVRR